MHRPLPSQPLANMNRTVESADPFKILGITDKDKEIIDTLSDDLKNRVLGYEAYKMNTGLMNHIIAQMKEIPILPSEVPPDNDRNNLIKVEFPEEGGVLTYMEGYDLPYRGFPYFELVEKIDVIKKLARAFLSGVYHALKAHWWLIPLLAPALLVARDLISAGLYTFYKLIDRFKLKPIRLSQAMRSLHNSFSSQKIKDAKIDEIRIMLRDIICHILELDNAYRFRAQDLVEELDKTNLNKNPIKELNRILTIAQGRETTQEISDTWKLLKLFNSFYLRFDRKMLYLVKNVLNDLDIDKFKLTPEDKQFCLKRKDYIFGFTLK